MNILFLSVLLLAQFFASAQQSRPPLFYQYSASFLPFSMIGPDHTFMLSGERRKGNLALVLDAGLTLSSSYLREAKDAEGFTIRPGIRFYVGRRLLNYVQPQAFYKQVTYQMYDWLGKDCVNDVPAYEELQDFRIRNRVMGGHLIYGSVLPLSRTVFLDLYVGLGMRTKRQELLGEPNACYDLDIGFPGNTPLDDVEVTPSLPMGFRFTFALR